MSAPRAELLTAAVADRGLDRLIVGDLVRPGDSGPDAIANTRWLTGFTGTSGLVIAGGDRPVFITDFRYTERAELEVDPGFERVTAGARLLPEVASRLSGRVGFDDEATSVANLAKLEKAIEEADSTAELVATSGMVEALRRRKDEGEQAAIAEAARITDDVYESVLAGGIAGRTEREIAAMAETRMRELGAAPAFPVIVAAGENGALPHAEPSDRVVRDGDLVVWDMGARIQAYCSDCTRTFAVGEPEPQAREVYELVLAAQEAALAAIRAGVGGQEADEVARAIIREGGHGDEFGHGLGHGVGLEIHEAPRLGPSSEDVLVEGDAVTIEPGIYVSGRFGVRIEDLVIVTSDGYRNLSSLSKDLRIVG